MAIALRQDFDADSLRAAAKKSRDAAQTRRLLSLAAIYGGAERGEAAKIGGVTRQIVRDWVPKFNADGPDGLVDRKAPGQSPRLSDAHRAWGLLKALARARRRLRRGADARFLVNERDVP